MATESENGRPVRRRRLWLRLLLLLSPVLGVVLVGGLLYRHHTRPERIQAAAEAYLQRYTRGRVTVGSASFTWLGGVRLLDVTVDELPSTKSSSTTTTSPVGSADPVFSCREVKLTHNLLSVFTGRLKIESVVAIEPTCSIVRNRLDGCTNLDGLLRFPKSLAPGETIAPPTVELSNAVVRVISRDEDGDRLVEELRLNVRARPSKRDSAVYDVVWQAGDRVVSNGHTRIDLETGRLHNLRGGLPAMSIEAVMLVVDAGYDGAGVWCELLGLDGFVRVRDYHLGAILDPHDQRSATIELSDASISIPIDAKEQPLSPEERYLQFEHVNGQVKLAANEIHATFTGLFHGSECEVTATLRGGVEKLLTFDDLDFQARLTMTDLVLPRPGPAGSPSEARFISSRPKLVSFYRDYDPVGKIDLQIDVEKRAGPGQPVVLNHAMLTAKGGNASCRFFPYRLHNVSGSVEYSPDGVFIRDIRGEREGGVVTVDGWLEKPSREAAKKVIITGSGIPIDEAMAQSLPERYRKIIEQFDPAGVFEVKFVLEQPRSSPGKRAKWQSAATITLGEVSARYAGFPYPLEHLEGTITVANDRLRLVDLISKMGETRININGDVISEAGKMIDLDVTIHGRDVPFDATLYSALSVQARRHLEAFQPSGRFDVETSLAFDPKTGKVRPTSRVTLKDVAIQHQKFPVKVENVRGSLTITDRGVDCDDLVGQYHGATVSANGTVAVAGEGGRGRSALTIEADGLMIDQELRSALPESVRTALAKWRIEDPINTETVVTTDPASDEDSISLKTIAQLDGVSVHNSFFPIPFTETRARIIIDDVGLRAQGVEARYGEANLHLGFDFGWADKEGESGRITISATHLPLGDSLWKLLPDRLASFWDRSEPSGVIDVQLDLTRTAPSDPEQHSEWSVTAYLELNDVTLPQIGGQELVSGTVSGSGMVMDRLGGTALTGTVSLSKLGLWGQRLTQFESGWSYARTASGDGFLKLDSIQSRIHDGSLTARAELSFDGKKTEYSLVATVHGMQIEPFMNADKTVRSTDQKPADVRGVADAHLYLSGILGDASSNRGGGRFEIADGRIYRLPLILAILNVLNLAVPDQDAFERVRAEFFIVGQRAQLNNILLLGSFLTLEGSGTLSLPDRAVDLRLVHVSPHGWARIPVLTDMVEGASRELVELHVTGPLSQPTVRARPFRAIQDEFENLFRKRKPKRIQPDNP